MHGRPSSNTSTSLGCCLENEQKLLNSINHHQGMFPSSERVSRLNLHCDGEAKLSVVLLVYLVGLDCAFCTGDECGTGVECTPTQPSND